LVGLKFYNFSFGQTSVIETNEVNAFSPGYSPYGAIADSNALAHVIVNHPHSGKYSQSLNNNRALFRFGIDKGLRDFHCDSLLQQTIARMKY
jgi:hypothetical protein